MQVSEREYQQNMEIFGLVFGKLADMEAEKSNVNIAEARGIIVQKLFDIMIVQENERRANGGAPIPLTEDVEEDEDDDCVVLTPIDRNKE